MNNSPMNWENYTTNTILKTGVKWLYTRISSYKIIKLKFGRELEQKAK
jgi:hypothetical protein